LKYRERFSDGRTTSPALRQAFQIGREAFLLGAWRYKVGAHDQQLNIKTLKSGDRVGHSAPEIFIL
jgi:hypothetical protein